MTVKRKTIDVDGCLVHVDTGLWQWKEINLGRKMIVIEIICNNYKEGHKWAFNDETTYFRHIITKQTEEKINKTLADEIAELGKALEPFRENVHILLIAILEWLTKKIKFISDKWENLRRRIERS